MNIKPRERSAKYCGRKGKVHPPGNTKSETYWQRRSGITAPPVAGGSLAALEQKLARITR